MLPLSLLIHTIYIIFFLRKKSSGDGPFATRVVPLAFFVRKQPALLSLLTRDMI